MMAGRGAIEEGIALLILQAGWNGGNVLEAELAIRAAAGEPEADIFETLGE